MRPLKVMRSTPPGRGPATSPSRCPTRSAARPSGEHRGGDYERPRCVYDPSTRRPLVASAAASTQRIDPTLPANGLCGGERDAEPFRDRARPHRAHRRGGEAPLRFDVYTPPAGAQPWAQSRKLSFGYFARGALPRRRARARRCSPASPTTWSSHTTHGIMMPSARTSSPAGHGLDRPMGSRGRRLAALASTSRTREGAATPARHGKRSPSSLRAAARRGPQARAAHPDRACRNNPLLVLASVLARPSARAPACARPFSRLPTPRPWPTRRSPTRGARSSPPPSSTPSSRSTCGVRRSSSASTAPVADVSTVATCRPP